MTNIGETVISSVGKRRLRRCLKDLRAVIDESKDPTVQRIGYAMETAIRWATEKTVGWQEPAEEAKILARMLRDELRLAPLDSGA